MAAREENKKIYELENRINLIESHISKIDNIEKTQKEILYTQNKIENTYNLTSEKLSTIETKTPIIWSEIKELHKKTESLGQKTAYLMGFLVLLTLFVNNWELFIK